MLPDAENGEDQTDGRNHEPVANLAIGGAGGVIVLVAVEGQSGTRRHEKHGQHKQDSN